MTNVIEIHSEANVAESRTSLDALCLEGARQLLHHAHVLKAGPRSWRTRANAPLRAKTAAS
jgi:hypothetical protein